MDSLSNLLLGFHAAISLENLAYAFVDCSLGTLIGILPGLDPLPALIMLAVFRDTQMRRKRQARYFDKPAPSR